MTINILDKAVVKNYEDNLQKQVDGIRLVVLDSKETRLYNGVVWPNE